MDLTELRGRAVVSVLQAEKLGAIDDVLVDLQKNRVGGLVLRGGLFHGGPVVGWNQVRNVGPDAVMVDDKSAAQDSGTQGMTRLSDMQGLKVVTDTGELVGTLDGADVDPATGQVAHYFVAPAEGGHLFHSAPRFMVPPPAIAAVGKDLVTVDARVIDMQRKEES